MAYWLLSGALSWRPNTRTPEFPPVAAQCSLFLGSVAEWPSGLAWPCVAAWGSGAAEDPPATNTKIIRNRRLAPS